MNNRIKLCWTTLRQAYLVCIMALGTSILISCHEDLDAVVSPNEEVSKTSIFSVANDGEGITAGFYFLPPMARAVSYSGVFDPALSPVVEICETPACTPPLHASYTMNGTGPGSSRIRVDTVNEHYIVNWNTKQTGAVVGRTYKVQVKLNDVVLGHTYVQIVKSSRGGVSVGLGAITLVAGQTLPIKFRIEKGDDIQVPGRDIVVFNDVNPFADDAMANPNNVRLVDNLINFTATGPRNAGKSVWFDCGRNSVFAGACAGTGSGYTFNILSSRITAQGFTLTNISSSSGTLINIPQEVKILFLWLPTIAYTVEEVNALKKFAAEGGRIVFIGEWDGFYGHAGLSVENQLFVSLGAVLRNTGGAVDCGTTLIPTASIRQHPITEGITNLTIACASVIEPGLGDYALFYDTSNSMVLAGVAKIDTTLITELVLSSEQVQPLRQQQLKSVVKSNNLDTSSPAGN